jgi:hypothetical protein
MCCLFGPVLVNYYADQIANVSAIWFMAALALHAIAFESYENDVKFSLKTITLTLFWILFIQINIIALSFLHILPPKSELHIAVNTLAKGTLTNVFPQICSFILASSSISVLLEYRKKGSNRLFWYVGTMLFAIVLSSITFYPIAYKNSYELLSIFFTGMSIKLGVIIVFYPMMYLSDVARARDQKFGA